MFQLGRDINTWERVVLVANEDGQEVESHDMMRIERVS